MAAHKNIFVHWYVENLAEVFSRFNRFMTTASPHIDVDLALLSLLIHFQFEQKSSKFSDINETVVSTAAGDEELHFLLTHPVSLQFLGRLSYVQLTATVFVQRFELLYHVLSTVTCSQTKYQQNSLGLTTGGFRRARGPRPQDAKSRSPLASAFFFHSVPHGFRLLLIRNVPKQ